MIKRPGRNGRDNAPQCAMRGECYWCGRRGHFARDPQCPAREKTFSKYSQRGQFANLSKTKFTEVSSRSRVRYTCRLKIVRRKKMSMSLQSLMMFKEEGRSQYTVGVSQ